MLQMAFRCGASFCASVGIVAAGIGLSFSTPNDEQMMGFLLVSVVVGASIGLMFFEKMKGLNRGNTLLYLAASVGFLFAGINIYGALL